MLTLLKYFVILLWLFCSFVTANAISVFPKFFGPTRSCDDLKAIIQHTVFPSGLRQNQIVLAFVHRNPQAFLQGNHQGLKTGYFLQIPSVKTIQSISPDEALATINSQNQAWQSLEPTLAHSADRFSLTNFQKTCSSPLSYDSRFFSQPEVSFPGLKLIESAYQAELLNAWRLLQEVSTQQEKLSSENQQLLTSNQQIQLEKTQVNQQIAQLQVQRDQLYQQVVSQQKTINSLKQEIPSELSFGYILGRLLIDIQNRSQKFYDLSLEKIGGFSIAGGLIIFLSLLAFFPAFGMSFVKKTKVGYEKNKGTAHFPMAEAVSSPVLDKSSSPVMEKSFAVSKNKSGINYSYIAGDDVVASKLDLARAYLDMGDQSSAKDLLQAIVQEGNDKQKKEASDLLTHMRN